MKKHTALRTTVGAMLVGSLFAGCSSPPSILDGGTVVIGAKNDQPGTSYAEDANDYKGFDIMVARRVLEGAKFKKMRFEGLVSKNRVEDLQHGYVELVAATYSITPKRMAEVDFVGPYASTRQGMLIRKEDAKKYKGVPDFFSTGEQVCVWEGTTSERVLKTKAYSEISTVSHQDAGDCVDELKAKNVVAISTDRLILFGLAQKHSDFMVVPKIEFGGHNHYGIAIAKKHREECRTLRDALKAYLRTTDWDDDINRYLPSVPQAERDEARPDPDQDVDDVSCRDKPTNSEMLHP